MRGLRFREVQWLDRGPTAGQWLRQDQSPGPRAGRPGLCPRPHHRSGAAEGRAVPGAAGRGVASGLGVMLGSTHRHRLPREDGVCGRLAGGCAAVGHGGAGEVRSKPPPRPRGNPACSLPAGAGSGGQEAARLTRSFAQVSLHHPAVLPKGRRRRGHVRPHGQTVLPGRASVAEQRGGELLASWEGPPLGSCPDA